MMMMRAMRLHLLFQRATTQSEKMIFINAFEQRKDDTLAGYNGCVSSVVCRGTVPKRQATCLATVHGN
jgi:hypothetical protein